MIRVLTYILPFILLISCTSTKKITTPKGISEINYLKINNSKQFVLIRGEDKSNPVLLFLHGGPGASETALFRKYNGELEKYFTVVYWDQRGAGKSFNKSISKQEIKVSTYLNDIDSLVNYLKSRFNVEKIFLVGHSWGTRLGLMSIQKNPENYIGYVGVGQELVSLEGERISYNYTLKKARETNNLKAIKDLEEMGEPGSGDYTKMYKNGFWGLVKQKDWLLKLGGEFYEKTNYKEWIKAIWLSKEYTVFDLVRYARGSAFSAGNIIYDPAFNNIDYFNQIPEVKIPVYFISGAQDYNTPWELAERYAQSVKSPHSEFIKFERSGHSPVFEEPERFNEEILKIYNKLKIQDK